MSREIRAIQVAIACSVIGTLAKAIVGVITGSMTMISSAVDSAGECWLSSRSLEEGTGA
jgi:divalent metal cation (Fe/Co/Zn/Cd) transporter